MYLVSGKGSDIIRVWLFKLNLKSAKNSLPGVLRVSFRRLCAFGISPSYLHGHPIVYRLLLYLHSVVSEVFFYNFLRF